MQRKSVAPNPVLQLADGQIGIEPLSKPSPMTTRSVPRTEIPEMPGRGRKLRPFFSTVLCPSGLLTTTSTCAMRLDWRPLTTPVILLLAVTIILHRRVECACTG